MKSNTYLDELKYVPYHKTGFKILWESQLENMFPSYEVILQKIEMHRQNLEKMGNGFERFDSQFNLMYDNVFSILGKRGSGKTSAVFTIKSMLQHKNEYDIVLPVVMPEVIPKECSMIGWVLSLLEQTVDVLEKQINEQQKYENYFEDCSYSPRKTLRREYDEIKELCYSQFYNVESTDSLANVISNSEQKTQNSFDFSRGIAHFWNSLKHAIGKVTGFSDNSQKREPLIYIFFDDVDLMPERVMDLFFTIIKYLSHPNIIVFVTADEELLYDVIENEMNERLGKYREVFTYGLASSAGPYFRYEKPENREARIKLGHKLQVMKEMPKLYGDKILPPSSRFYLETYDTCSKKSTFIERCNEDGAKITLKDFMLQQMEHYLKENGLEVKKDNFLLYQGEFVNTYFNFWGETSRQLANECLIMEEFFNSLERCRMRLRDEKNKNELYLRDLFHAVYYFVYNTLNAYGDLGMNSSELKDMVNQIVLYRPESWGIYIDYSYLKHRTDIQLGIELDSENIAEIDMEKTMKENSLFFTLLFFVENILYLEGKAHNLPKKYRRTLIHGQSELVEIFDFITQDNISLICRNPENMNAFLRMYGDILENPEIIRNFKLTDASSVRRYFDALPTNVNNMQKSPLVHSRKNPLWFETMVKVLFLTNENIYSVKDTSLPYHNMPALLRRYDPFFTKMMDNLRESFISGSIKDAQARHTQSQQPVKTELRKYSNEAKKIDKDLVVNFKGEPTFNEQVTTLDEIEQELKNFCESAKIDYMLYVFAYMKQFEICPELVTYMEMNNNEKNAPSKTKSLERICEKLKETFIKAVREFKYYKIKSPRRFHNILANNNMRCYTEEQVAGKDKVECIDTERMWHLSNKLRMKLLYENDKELELFIERNSTDFGYSTLDQLTDLLQICLLDQEDIRRGIEVVVISEIFAYMTRLYLRSLLDDSSQYSALVDKEHMPYGEFYNNIIDILIKNKNNYLTFIINQYVADALAEYYNFLMGISENG